ncbi:unnamed protein product [Urochloa decumbens]|uniref:Uncharacterized protein n=1 Tax=Urochloa decumbens TaxID=240449 RepID=A0ABC9EJN2_9POAL
MDAREGGVRRDPAAGAATDGGELAGQQPIDLEQQASGVDFVLQGSTVLGAGDLIPQGLLAPAAGVAGLGSPDLGGSIGSTSTGLAVDGHDRASSIPGRVNGVGELGPPDDQLERPLLVDAEHAGGFDPPAPAARHGPERGPPGVVVLRLDVRFQHAAAGAWAGAMRLAALLVMSLAAGALVGGDQDAPWPSQFRALMIWLEGCVVLYLLRH